MTFGEILTAAAVALLVVMSAWPLWLVVAAAWLWTRGERAESAMDAKGGE